MPFMKNHTLRALALTGPLLLVAACSAGPNGLEQSISPQAAHPVVIKKVDSTLSLDVPAGAYKMPAGDADRISQFAYGYQVRGHGAVVVKTPSGSANAGAARAAARQIVAKLGESGVLQKDVRLVSYQAEAGSNAPVVLSHDQFQANSSSCENAWSNDLTRDHTNVMSSGYGCATQNNIAALVSDPYDLVRMRSVGPADARRRDTVLDKYQKGEVSSANRSDDERVNVTSD